MNLDNNLFNKIFLWIGIGLLISFGTGYYLSTNIILLEKLLIDVGLIWILIITVALTFVFKFFLLKLPKEVLYILYIAFALIFGVTIASVFIIYEVESIIQIFLVTSIIFIIMTIYGSVTKKDLSSFGKILMFGLLGVIIFSILNIFIFKSEMFDVILTSFSALIFIIFIAYDIQKIKRLMVSIPEDRLVIYGAFELYLDFINVFLDLIRLFGRRK